MVLGLVPDCPVDGVRSVGNAAGAGAVQALLSRALRAEMEAAVRRVIKIETATEPRFQELFVAAMALPHATSPSPNLATVVDLPAREPAASRRWPPSPGTRAEPAPGAPNSRRCRTMSWRMSHERTSRAAWWWSGRSPEHAGGGHARPVAVHHAPPDAGRADLGRGSRDPRAQRRHDPRRGRRRDPRPPECRRSCSPRPAPTSTAAGCGSRAGCAARSCRPRRRPCTPSTPATPTTTCRSVATRPCSHRTTARRSCTTSRAVGATPRSPTSRTS